MNYETWVTILLAALAVLLSIVTLIVAIAGIVIALVGIWGIRALKKAAEQKAHEAVKKTISEYPDAAHFMEVSESMRTLYGEMQMHFARMRQQISRSDHEMEVLHRRTEAANEILDRLNLGARSAASNEMKSSEEPSDTILKPVTASYPGEEVSSDASDTGNVLKSDNVGSANAG